MSAPEFSRLSALRDVLSAIKCGSEEQLLSCIERAALELGKCLEVAAGERFTLAGVLAIAYCYRSAPHLAFVRLSVRSGRGFAEIALPNRIVRMTFDELSWLLGPRIEEERFELELGDVYGPYVPVTCRYLISRKPMGAKHSYRVVYRNRVLWYLYPADDPVPHNVYEILSLA